MIEGVCDDSKWALLGVNDRIQTQKKQAAKRVSHASEQAGGPDSLETKPELKEQACSSGVADLNSDSESVRAEPKEEFLSQQGARG